jgi:hypothetical protein
MTDMTTKRAARRVTDQPYDPTRGLEDQASPEARRDPSAGASGRLRYDPTRGLEDQASPEARRDPSAGASARGWYDPTRGLEDQASPEARRDPTEVLRRYDSRKAAGPAAPARVGRRDAGHQSVATSPSPRYRPAGHVVGHAIGEHAPSPRGNRPAGHVVGHGVWEHAPLPRGNRPAGHVVGRGVGDPAPSPRGNRPAGHVVGNEAYRPER